MFDEEERRKELKDIISNYPFEVDKYNKIISEEKSMIEQAKKEALKDVLDVLKYSRQQLDIAMLYMRKQKYNYTYDNIKETALWDTFEDCKNTIDKLLKEYGVI